MIDSSDFNSVFAFNPSFSYDTATTRNIQKNRQKLGNELFFDRLLIELLGLKGMIKLAVKQASLVDSLLIEHGVGPQLYPPQSNNALRQLFKRISQAGIAEHHKQSLLFYLLKDCAVSGNDDPAGQFARECHLPDKYWVCLEGFWEMDHLNFRVGTVKTDAYGP
jgi:hypothetical protein